MLSDVVAGSETVEVPCVSDRMHIAGSAVRGRSGSWSGPASVARLLAESTRGMRARPGVRTGILAARGVVRPRRLRRGASAARLLIPVAAVGMLVGGTIMSVRQKPRAWTVSEVTEEFRRLAIDGGAQGDRYAGSLGPMRIATRTIDGSTGDFLGFRIETETMLVTAARATLDVDPDRDTFAFDLRDVTFTRLVEAGQDGLPVDGDPSLVHTTDRHLFGPAAFGSDIVPDGEGSTVRRPPRRPFGPRGANADSGSGSGDGPSWLRDAGAEN